MLGTWRSIENSAWPGQRRRAPLRCIRRRRRCCLPRHPQPCRKKINRSHAHAHDSRTTPPTHTHDKNDTRNPQTNTPPQPLHNARRWRDDGACHQNNTPDTHTRQERHPNPPNKQPPTTTSQRSKVARRRCVPPPCRQGVDSYVRLVIGVRVLCTSCEAELRKYK